MTTKESIIVAYLEFLMNNKEGLDDLIKDIGIIRLHTTGYEKLVEDYSKQMINILSREE